MADNVVDMLAIEIEANAMQSVDGVKRLSRALSSLAKSVSKVNGAGINNVSASLKVMNTATGTAAQNMDKSSKGTKRFGTSLGLLNGSMRRSNSGMKSLAYHFGKFYANCFLAIRGARAFGSAIGSTMDYIEAFNFFDVATNSATARTGEWKELGYSSAEEYAKAFEQGLSNLNEKMTGFKVDVQTGDFDVSSMANLGINLTDLTTFEAEITSITSSLGLCTKTSYNTSKALAMLSADMSSLHNIDLSTVMTNFQSGLIGQSRALYKYGIDITNATLQTYAYANGISKAVSEMTQSEKMQLRMLAILDQSKNSWGDLANTINQPANQLRVLKNGFKNLAITIGKLFMPIVSAILPYLNAMVKSLQYLFTWLAKVAGVNLEVENSGSGVSSAVDDMEDLEDSTNNANTAAKKLQNTIYGFDEINKRDSDSSSNASSGGGTGVDLSDAISSALAEYEAAWEAAYANMQDKSTKMANAIVSAFQKGDYKAIGTYISTGLTNAMNGIKWSSIYNVANGFGSGLAKFLNGLITPKLFASLGKTVAGGINTAIRAVLGFSDNFKFSNLGKSIAAGLNKAVKGIDWKGALKSSSNIGTGIADTLNSFLHDTDFSALGSTVANGIKTAINLWYTFVKTFEFSQLGGKIADSINGFFSSMGTKSFDGKSGKMLTGWQKLGYSISDTIKGISKAITTALEGADWDAVGQGIADMICSIDWSGVVWNFGRMTLSLIKAIGTTITSLGDTVGEYIWDLITGDTKGSDADLSSMYGMLKNSFTGQYSREEELLLSGAMSREDAQKSMSVAKAVGDKNGADALEKAIETYDSRKKTEISIDVKTSKKQVQTDVNGTINSINNSKNVNNLFTDIETDDKKDSNDIFSRTQKSLSKLSPLGIETKSRTKAEQFIKPLQESLLTKSLSIEAKTNNTGDDLYNTLQRRFGLKNLLTGSSVTNTGTMLRNGLQNTFNEKNLKTRASVTNSGGSIREGLQIGFGNKNLHTGANVTTSGTLIWQKLQDTFGKNNLSTGVSLPDGWAAFSENWNKNKETLKAGISMDVQAKADGKFLVPKTLTSILINGYAKGGFPSQGDLFIANENGPELVGGMNGKTTVANQNEIADGFASAIYPSMYSAVKNAMSGSGNNNQPIVVENTIMADTEVLYQKTEQGRKKSERRYGTTVSLA